MEEGVGSISSSRSSGEKKVRALVVDDEGVTRYIHMSLLKKMNVEVEVAENGMAALSSFQCGNSFDFVLMDLEMPLMDGAQVQFFSR